MILSHPLSGRLTQWTSTRLTTPCGVCFRSESIVPRSCTSINWNDASSASGPLWVKRLLTVLLESGVSVYALAFMLEADVLSTCWNKDCVMWHVRQWPFWETITRAPSRSRKPLWLAYDSLRLASRLKPAIRGFYGGSISYGELANNLHN